MKITGDKLLEIDPSKLFVECTVSELQDIQKQLNDEIEKKRENLRSTVGGRYRELLKAADTITEMKDTGMDVVAKINRSTVLIQALQEKHLIGFKTEPAVQDMTTHGSDEVSKNLEIKLLIDMPDLIWTALDEQKLVDAVKFYLLAEHTHLGLTVSRTASGNISILLETLWNTIVSCRQSILTAIKTRMSSLQLVQQDAADCFCALLLLEPKECADVLGEFLTLRKDVLRQMLVDDNESTVKEKLQTGVKFVRETLLIICESFLECEPGIKNYIEVLVENSTGKDAPSVISMCPPISPLAPQYFSLMVKQFKPRTAHPVTSLTESYVKEVLTKWVENVKEILKKEMPNILVLVGNLRGIVSVRKTVSAVVAPAHWNRVEKVLGPSRIEELLIEPHVTARTLELIGLAWKDAVNSFINALALMDEELLNDSRDGRTNQPEQNIKWFLWKESDDVTLQTLGCTPRVTSLCQVLENGLKSLVDDVNTYTSNTKKSAIVLNHLSLCSYENVKILTETVLEAESLKDLSEASLILRARLLQSIATQCPSLKDCFNSDGSHCWSETTLVLHSACQAMWRLWLAHLKPELETLITAKLDPDVAVETFLLSRPACEVVTITEETEDNTSVNSQLCVPSQPTFSLQEALLQACIRINAVAVHSIPSSIQEEITREIVDVILSHYEKLCTSDLICQSYAWQLLLDIRFLALLFLPHDNQGRVQSLAARLEDTIDPFDLNVSYPFLAANVKKCAVRLQGTFGVLVNHGEKLAVLNSMKVSASPASSTSEDPLVLACSNNVPWFPLLPISSGSSRKKDQSPGRQAKPRSKDSKKETTSSDFMKSAGAFFGSMTGGWS